MKAAFLVLTALLLVGCTDTYRYPCQDPANKDNPDCNRPKCEVDGFCFDTLNGLTPEKAAEIHGTQPEAAVPTVEESPAAVPAEDEVKKDEPTGE
jgi:hypothetical protein